MNRYSAKLLFQYRTDDGKEKRRICEERIVTFEARSPRLALRTARSIGRKAQFTACPSFYKQVSYCCASSHKKATTDVAYMRNATGRIHFEFVGVLDLVDLTICEPNEVWYDISKHRVPVERLIPSDKQLIQRN